MTGLRWTEEQLAQWKQDALARVRPPPPWRGIDALLVPAVAVFGGVLLQLPYPPSGNLSVRHSKNGSHYAPEPVRRFRKEVEAMVVANGQKNALEGRLRALLTIHPKKPKKWRSGDDYPRCIDWDNAAKTVCDALQHAGVFKSDAQIHDGRVIKGEPVPGGAVLVRLEVMA